MRKCNLLAVLGLLSLAPAVALANTIPGFGGTDPVLIEGIVNSGFGTVAAGDVVVCDFGLACTSTIVANWSDVLVFYNSTKGPFVTDSSVDATLAYIFSDDTDLGTFLSNYNTGIGGANGLSNNAQFINEDAIGNVNYGGYTFSSPEVPVPEPSAMLLLGSALLGLGFARHKFARG